MTYVVLGGLWTVYLALHSLLASNGAKGWFEKWVRLSGSKYRLFYSLLSTIGIIAIGWVSSIFKEKLLFNPSISQYFGVLLIFPGIWILWLSFKYFSVKEFLGLKATGTENQLVTSGIHARVRHPIYTGTVLALVGYFLIRPTDLFLVSLLVIFVYLPIGIVFEEKKLIEKFGQDYLNYRRNTPAIFPDLK